MIDIKSFIILGPGQHLKVGKKEKRMSYSSTFYFKGAMTLVRTTFSAKRH